MARRSCSTIWVRAWLNWARYSLMRSLDMRMIVRDPRRENHRTSRSAARPVGGLSHLQLAVAELARVPTTDTYVIRSISSSHRCLADACRQDKSLTFDA